MPLGAARIVIIGGGFAGMEVARRLEKITRRNPEVRVTLIDTENYFTFTPLLPEVPSGSVEPKHIVVSLRSLLRHTEIRQARVESIDLAGRLVMARHCDRCEVETIGYDQLVLAPGAVLNLPGTPGVLDHALPVKSLADAARLHAHLVDRLEHAELQDDPALRRELLSVVVAGGGFAGVEIVAELNDFLRDARRFYPQISPDEIQLVLVHSGTRILAELSVSLSAFALKQLRKRGVEVRLQTRIQSCTANQVLLSNGEALKATTLVWATGTASNPLLKRLELPKAANGRIVVDDYLAVQGAGNIWALGDCASTPDLVSGGDCPPTAQFALRQGRCVADNLIARLQGKPGRPFRFKAIGLLAGLGRRSAVAEILGVRFSGFVAWWLWRTIYLMKLPGLERKLRVAFDWTLDLFFDRDLVFLRPLHGMPAGAEVISGQVPLAEAVKEQSTVMMDNSIS